MIERTYIHVAGPAGAGKTTFVEALIAATDEAVAVARCATAAPVKNVVESSPADDPEIHRYHEAGAIAAARIAFPSAGRDPDAFFDTDFMGQWPADVVVMEGDDPLGYADLRVFIAPPLRDRAVLFETTMRDRLAGDRAKAARWEQLLNEPGGMARWAEEVIGLTGVADMIARGAGDYDAVRTTMLAGVAQLQTSPPQLVATWSVAPPYAGIEHAGLVIANVRRQTEVHDAVRLVAEITALRQDRELFDEILSYRGTRVPITAVPADLADPRDPGRRKAMARAQRALAQRG